MSSVLCVRFRYSRLLLYVHTALTAVSVLWRLGTSSQFALCRSPTAVLLLLPSPPPFRQASGTSDQQVYCHRTSGTRFFARDLAMMPMPAARVLAPTWCEASISADLCRSPRTARIPDYSLGPPDYLRLLNQLNAVGFYADPTPPVWAIQPTLLHHYLGSYCATLIMITNHDYDYSSSCTNHDMITPGAD